MLQKTNRISNDSDFNKIFRKSKPVFTRNLTVRVFATKKDAPIRFGFIVSNKVCKKATDRNALKRQLRQISQDLLLECKSGYDVVVFVKVDFLHPYDQAEIRKQVTDCLKKEQVL